MEYVGKRYVFSYESGLEVEAFYPSEDRLEWTALSGPAHGSTGSESTRVIRTAARQFFINWIESSGTTVSNLLNLDAMTVASFVTWESDGVRDGLVDSGTVTPSLGPRT